MADYNLLMKQRIANAWRDSKPLTPVVNDAQPVQDPMAAAKKKISEAWRRK
ncbi:hypothetical protein SMB94_001969 [Cronobacter sakazakii]|nr:hypothetical protein [Cronobacter sakazakii]EJG0745154.1 hypothetical protein [Cronobacter sakazakii]ELY2534665.1 hypothetical protein [Cronobacter sakazakii]ELY2538562.1 hypothetical protein [Cronobacter sakazakii]ELY4821443.1 hypothetical protein [Cronobacter sakazakii]